MKETYCPESRPGCAYFTDKGCIRNLDTASMENKIPACGRVYGFEPELACPGCGAPEGVACDHGDAESPDR